MPGGVVVGEDSDARKILSGQPAQVGTADGRDVDVVTVELQNGHGVMF